MKTKNELTASAGRMTRLVRKFVVWRYVGAGLQWGNAESYSGFFPIHGECVGYAGMLRKLNRWEARYIQLGFRAVDKRVWVEAGGYGRDYVSQLYLTTANVDLPDTAAQDSASKSNSPAVSG